MRRMGLGVAAGWAHRLLDMGIDCVVLWVMFPGGLGLISINTVWYSMAFLEGE